MNIIVLISGNGTNLQAIIDQFHGSQSDVKLLSVISNRPEAYGLERARKAGIPTHVVSRQVFAEPDQFHSTLHSTVVALDPDLIVLAGYMLILDTAFVNSFQGRLINIHPSLLPKYRGLNTHTRAINEKDKYHGASVHYVIPELDAGPVIMQAKIPIHSSDTAESLAQRVLVEEHKIYPAAIRLIAQKKVHLKQGQVYYNGKPIKEPLTLDTKEVVRE